MDEGGATRTELLARRAQIALAEQGRDLLQDKREQLMTEFRTTARTVLAGSDALEAAGAVARLALERARARDGPEAVASAAFAATGTVEVEAGVATIMSVRVPRIEHRPVGRPGPSRGYSLAATTPRIDKAAERFEAQVDLVLQVAAGEVRLRRLAAEISTTTRRVNALEHVVIPRLVSMRNLIERVLEEREREDHFRLKRVHMRRSPRSGRRP
ncbi:MAG: V-type ATP synthase subunit D [Acidimicrobiia bacterium]|nr:V-type ATP synthase subunit D [Acidimicrobiia bacterium]